MNELTLLREAGRELAPDPALPPSASRDRLLARLDAGTGTKGVVDWRRPLVLAAAAVTGIALVVAPGLPFGSDSATPSAAAAVLQHAADRAGGSPALVKDPGAYIYVARTDAPTKAPEVHLGDYSEGGTVPETRTRWWLPVDPARDDGLMQQQVRRPDGSWGRWTSGVLGGCPETCPPGTHGPFRDDLPTGKAAMTRYLRSLYPGSTDDYSAFLAASETLVDSYLPPAVARSLFEALAGLEAIDLRPDERDSAGRPAVAVSVRPPAQFDARGWLLFDPVTYEYLGSKLEQTRPSSVGPVGFVRSSSAVLEVTEVDRPGRRPDATP